MENKKETLAQKEAKLRVLIKTELDLCDSSKTPAVCSINKDVNEQGNLVNDIVDMIKKDGFTIGECIVKLERMYNNNLIND